MVLKAEEDLESWQRREGDEMPTGSRMALCGGRKGRGRGSVMDFVAPNEVALLFLVRLYFFFVSVFLLFFSRNLS